MRNNRNNRIIVNPKIVAGKPVIKGTRITVELVLHLLAQGQTVEEIAANYPHLNKQDILAAIEYARGVLEEEVVYPLAGNFYAKTKTFA